MQPFEEKLTTKWYRDYSHKLHIQRLQEIKSHASKRIDNSVPKSKDILPPHKQCKEFLQKEKKKLITKTNQQLLKVLTEITAGKRETVTQKILNSTRDTPTSKSLNITVRKKEARRIDEDNEELVKRLSERKPGLSFKKLQEEWSVVNKYRESISKKGYRNGSSQLTSRLPPMEEQQEKKEVSVEEGLSKTQNVINLPKIRKKLKQISLKQPEIVRQSMKKEKFEDERRSEKEKNEAIEDKSKEEKIEENKEEMELRGYRLGKSEKEGMGVRDNGTGKSEKEEKRVKDEREKEKILDEKEFEGVEETESEEEYKEDLGEVERCEEDGVEVKDEETEGDLDKGQNGVMNLMEYEDKEDYEESKFPNVESNSNPAPISKEDSSHFINKREETLIISEFEAPKSFVLENFENLPEIPLEEYK